MKINGTELVIERLKHERNELDRYHTEMQRLVLDLENAGLSISDLAVHPGMTFSASPIQTRLQNGALRLHEARLWVRDAMDKLEVELDKLETKHDYKASLEGLPF